MAVRQYIGARYVPKFFENAATGDSTWAANTAYEPLTIVTYNGNSYTSKKTVPAGIGDPSANAEYWASTGMFNAQVETIREEIEELAGFINETNDNQRLINRKIVLITDSYGVASQTGTATVWTNLFKSKLGLSEGTDCFTYAAGGAGFVNGEFLNMLNSSAGDPAYEITDIIVAGGCNDYGQSEGDILSAISTFKAAAADKYPNALISIATIGHTKQAQYRDSAAIQIGAYYAAAGKNCRVLRGTENALHVNNMWYDDVHPNAAGAEAIARAMSEAFITGSASVVRYANPTITPIGSHVLGTANIYQAQHDNNILCTIFNRASMMSITIHDDDGVKANTDYEVGTFSDDSLVFGNTEMQCSFPLQGTAYYSGNNHQFSGVGKINAGKLLVAVIEIDGINSGFPANVQITPGQMYAVFDSLMC